MAVNTTAVSSAWGAGSAPRASACTRAAGAALVLCTLALASAPAAGAAACPNEAIRSEQGTAALPDCRAYELVSPAAKDNSEPRGPLSQNGRAPEPTRGAGARAASGVGRLTWVAEYALPERSLTRPYEPGVPGLQYLSRRSDSGWFSENVIPPQSVQYGLLCPNYVGIVAWSPDLRRGVLADGLLQESELSPGGPFGGASLECGHDEPLLAADQPPGFEEREGFQNLFLRAEEGGSYALVNPTPTGAPHPRPASAKAAQDYFPAAFLAGSDDLSHVVFEEELPLTPQAEEITAEVKLACGKPEGEERRACWEGHDNLYQWSEAPGGGGTVSLVTILPGEVGVGGVTTPGAAVQGTLAGATRNNGGVLGARPLSLLTPNVANFRHAVSADGSRVFFEVGGFGAGKDPSEGALYVREDGAKTVQIDSPLPGSPLASTPGGGEFLAASASGRKVYFSADASHLLTADTVPGSGQNLYQCELPAEDGGPCALTDLTPAPEAGVLGVMGTSEGTAAEEAEGPPDVYFVATGALPTASHPPTSAPVPGEPNLYLRHGAATSFIATLDGTEVGKYPNGGSCTKASPNTTEACLVTYGDSSDWTARGGSEFLYGTEEKLISAFGGLTARVSANGRFLAFNSVNELTGYDNTDANSGEADNQIFLYDAATQQLSCASCNPDPGVRPTAPAAIREPASPYLVTEQKARYPQRNLSDNGQLFFDSQDALLPERDTNGALDVYEYQAGAVDPLQLISSGKSEVESFFLDASPDGRDVFFMTAEQLLGRDRDAAYDIYDAREGGGFPEPPTPAPPCEGEAGCRAPPASPPAFPAPLSAVFQGPGNESAPKKAKRCRRGQKRVVRKGKARCVRKHRRGHGAPAGKRAHRSRRAGRGARAAAHLSGSAGAASAEATPRLFTNATEFRSETGKEISDIATLTEGSAPTGTIIFRAYGPNDPSCTKAPAYTSSPVAVTGNGEYKNAPAFVPASTGTYRWIAEYSGDLNNNAVSGACNDKKESSTVTAAVETEGPYAFTGEAREVGETSAELRGSAFFETEVKLTGCVGGLASACAAAGAITNCWFEYATAEFRAEPGHGGLYDKTATCEPPPPYTPGTSGSAQKVVVTAKLGLQPDTALDPGTTYDYRLVVEGANGKRGEGAERTFTTKGSRGAPTIDAYPNLISRQGDGTYTVTMRARINPHGYPTTCKAQYLSEAQFRESKASEPEGDGYADATPLPCAPESLGRGFEAVTASAVPLSGLPPGARYHFRFLAHNEKGEVTGADRTLVTVSVESFSLEPSRLIVPAGTEPTYPYTFEPPQGQDLQAGGHPYELNDSFRLATTGENPWGSAQPSFAVVNPKDIVTTLPLGLIGNPQATPRCTQSELAHATCDGAAQVGVLRVEGNRQQAPRPPFLFPIYNLVPPPGVAAQLGVTLLKPFQANAHVDAGLDAGSGYAVKAAVLNITTAEGLISATATIWGVPHDPSHNGERFCPNSNNTPSPIRSGGECPSDEELESDLRPFLRNPTSCAEPAQAAMELDPWQGPGDFVGASAPYPQMEGCDEVPFDPDIALAPTTASADSPAGLHVDLHLPQKETCVPGPPVSCATGEADLRKAVVTLPRGLNVNPASADGLAGCSPALIGLLEGKGAHGEPQFSEGPARCPKAAKIATVEVETPLLDHPAQGGVYLATPYANPFNSLLAIYIAIDDPQTGVAVKLAGEVQIGPDGQLTTTFDESPQLPFEDFKLDFFAGPRAALRTPATCGTFTTTTDLTPWTAPAGANATPSSSFDISSGPNGGPCAHSAAEQPHRPALQAGTLTPRAGAYSPFVLHVTRADGSQELQGLDVTLPPGLTGKLAGIPYCPEQAIVSAAGRDGRYEAAHPDCPAASQVGTVTVGAGAGPKPLYVEGDAYLAGPYKGAPLSLAIVTPAVAGPFDLGTVVVRTALYVNPETAQIHAVSDPFPTVLEGIPLDVRSIAVQMDKPDFTLNPTSCEPMAIASTALSALGQAAPLSNRFQVGGCEALPFAPRLALTLKGRTRRGGNPALKAVLTAQPGEANIAAAQVTLPHSEFLDQGHIGTICTRVQFAEGSIPGEKCPAASVYGFARAETPLLDHPVEGPVYLRSSSNELPDLVAALGGQIEVVLAGRVDAVRGRIRNTFEVVPDAPVSRFTLEMQGGAKGLLVNSTNLCAKVNRALARFTGQNGKRFEAKPALKTSCKKKHRKKRRHHKGTSPGRPRSR